MSCGASLCQSRRNFSSSGCSVTSAPVASRIWFAPLEWSKWWCVSTMYFRRSFGCSFRKPSRASIDFSSPKPLSMSAPSSPSRTRNTFGDCGPGVERLLRGNGVDVICYLHDEIIARLESWKLEMSRIAF